MELSRLRKAATSNGTSSEDVLVGYDAEDEDRGSREQATLLPHGSDGCGGGGSVDASTQFRPRASRLEQVLYASFLLGGPLVFGLSFASRNAKVEAAALVVWVALWWITEIIPLGLTAFVPSIALPLMGLCKPSEVTACYLNPTIMLFVQSFLLAGCVHKYNLHKRVALNTMLVTGTKPGGILLGSIVITATLSMWMSNTSTSAMMVPLATSLYEALVEKRSGDEEAGAEDPGDDGSQRRSDAEKFGKGLMLSVAYSASIGGTATPIGTGPNLVLMQTWEDAFGESPGFLTFFGFGFSYAAVMLVLLYAFVYFFFCRGTAGTLPPTSPTQLRSMLRDLGPYSFPEKVVTASIFLVMAMWLTRKKPILGWGDVIGGNSHDYMPVMAAAILLSVVPERNPFGREGEGLTKRGPKILTMVQFRDVSWGVVFLLGGGFALSLGIQRSGLMENVSGALDYLKGHVGQFIFPLLITAAVTSATEFVSNVAMSSIILPVLANLGPTSANLGLIPATLACSCAFMLPSATPPNALAYGSGFLTMKDMVTSGLVMNVVGISLITFWSIFVAPIFFPEYSTAI